MRKINLYFCIIIYLIIAFGISINTLWCNSTQTNTSLLLPEYGYFNSYIIVPERATEIERYAAEELAKYIKKITGNEISVIKEQPNLEYFGFYIGRTEKGGRYKQPVTSPYDGANGFRIKSVPNGLIIIGADDLSTLFGVYAFLEEYQGCGWFMPFPLAEVVPHNQGILIPESLDVTQVPDIPIRWIGSGEWALRNRSNTAVQIHDHDVGVINKWHFHTYGLLVDPEHYFDDHPEYFSLLDRVTIERYHGKKIISESCRFWGITDNRSIHWQICTSHPEVVKLVTSHLVDTLTRNPSIEFISLAANDGYGFCQCSRYMSQMEPPRKDDRVGKETGPIFVFNNEVARRVKKFRPDQLIKVGAYSNYLRYPLDPSYIPEDNLAIQITPNIQFCHNHTITDSNCPRNADFIREYRMWEKHTNHLHVYGYARLRGWGMLRWPMVHCMQNDMKEYKKSGVELFFTQSSTQMLSNALNYHVAAKLAWNSSLSVDKLINDFCTKMYGAATPAMERFHRFIEDSWAANKHHVGYDVEPTFLSVPKFFPEAVVTRADQLLLEAENSDTDSLSKKRIHLIRIEFDYLRLVLNYLSAILKPFRGIDPERDSVGWENAGNQAESIGEVLSRGILGYMNENCPETMKSSYGEEVRIMLRTHNVAFLHSRLAQTLKKNRENDIWQIKF